MATEQTSEPPAKKQRATSPVKPPANLRTFQKIPIFIVDYHHNVLDFIYRCFGTRHLPLTGNTLVHFDSHPDMVISYGMTPRAVFNKDHLFDILSIENWIMPGCYAGHFKNIVWIKNSWCNQMPEGSYDFKIGDYLNEIRVDLPFDYFISEGNYCETELLKNSKDVHLDVITCDQLKEGYKIPISDTGHVILDVDLDFFSVNNPFLELYAKADVYNQLRRIFSYCKSGDVKKDNEMRRKQLEELEAIFSNLETSRCLEDIDSESIQSDLYDMVVDLYLSVIDNYPDDEIDWMLIFNAGNTTDNEGLPHHRSTDDELENHYKSFESFLKQTGIEPKVITIARSAEDDYCPKDQVDNIQEKTVQVLQSVYGEKVVTTPILAFKEEEWDVMKL